MRTRCVLALAAGLACIAFLAADASAMYHPTVGRFMQRDPIGYEDGENLYEYVGASPVDVLDPWGREARIVWNERSRIGGATRAEDVKAEWAEQSELDDLRSQEDKKLDIHYKGQAFSDLNAVATGDWAWDYGCCHCWFKDVTVTLTLWYWLSNDLIPKREEIKKAERHEHTGHLVQDFAGTFRDEELRMPLRHEVAQHDTPGEAYLLKEFRSGRAILHERHCAEACDEHVNAVAEERIASMRGVMDRRAKDRDEMEYGADLRAAREKKMRGGTE